MTGTIRKARPDDQDEWLRMRHALWPEETIQDLTADVQVWLKEERCVALVAERTTGELCGFLEVAIRPCDVTGDVGRFGYIEGWYVDHAFRRQGVGKSLVQAAEEWVRQQGVSQILSDVKIENRLSQTAHEALGFKEVERLVHFRKPLT